MIVSQLELGPPVVKVETDLDFFRVVMLYTSVCYSDEAIRGNLSIQDTFRDEVSPNDDLFA